MAEIREEVKFLLGIEGEFSNDPYDSGGATMWGITIGEYSKFKGRSVSVSELKAMSETERDQIYLQNYWNKMKLDLITDNRIQKILFDQGVNSGPQTIIKRAQTVLNEKFKKGLSVDGANGPKTSEAINSVDPEDFMTEFMIASELYYNAIIKRNTSQLVFINGWTNRRARLWRLITNGLDLMKKHDEQTKGGTLLELVKAFIKAFFENFGQNDPQIEEPAAKDTTLLKIMRQNPELDSGEVERALSFLDNPHVKKKIEMVFVDFKQNARNKRLYVIDLETGKAEKHQVAVGKQSDPDHDGVTDSVSNVSGSNKSSKGAMVLKEAYGKLQGGWSKFDYAVQIEGLEPGINDNVKQRAIVFHSSTYVSDVEGDLPGRSLGCFAVSVKTAKMLVSRLSGGVLLYASF